MGNKEIQMNVIDVYTVKVHNENYVAGLQPEGGDRFTHTLE